MKSQNTRKINSENKLRGVGIPINIGLPPIEADNEVKLRTPDEVARRAVVLFAVAVYGEILKQEVVNEILNERKAWDFVTPEEREFLHNPDPTPLDRMNLTWRYEGLLVMMWALGYIDELSYPSTMCDVPKIVTIFSGNPGESFVNEAKLRTKSEILDEADLIYRYHWAIVDARLNGSEMPGELDPGVVFERHYALNWLITYMNQDWDDITTDT